jgi:hypothetical protein
MTRKLPFALVAVLLATTPAVAADMASEATGNASPISEGRISGLVREIRPDAKLVLEEQGPWKGPGTGVSTRVVDLTPSTTIRVIRSTGRWEGSEAEPGYEIHPADFTALHIGDFVTVHTAADRSSVAAAVEIVRQEAADTGQASPRER